MSCKPEKIWRYKPDGQGARHTTEKTFTDSVEYIRADLDKPSEQLKVAVEKLLDYHTKYSHIDKRLIDAVKTALATTSNPTR